MTVDAVPAEGALPDERRAWELVLESIERDLLSGRLRPGDRLAPERALAASLGVGRSSVREALRVLEVLGLIRTATGSGPTSGAIIVALPGGGMSALMRLQVAAQGFPVADVVKTRLVLEAAVVTELADADGPARVGTASLARAEQAPRRDGRPGPDRGRVPRARRPVPPLPRRGVREPGHHRDHGRTPQRDRSVRTRGRCPARVVGGDIRSPQARTPRDRRVHSRGRPRRGPPDRPGPHRGLLRRDPAHGTTWRSRPRRGTAPRPDLT
ncbi:FadR/GntR family transcriptional regulator [Cryobacterium breve]|uniref:FadR/GntR family transcriptional regulator n=1 Tax=Cryobacterium breve TaxID=1259258 RepID=UPI003D7C1FE4